MKNKVYILSVLIALVSLVSANGAYAQRGGHFGGGGHFSGGGHFGGGSHFGHSSIGAGGRIAVGAAPRGFAPRATVAPRVAVGARIAPRVVVAPRVGVGVGVYGHSFYRGGYYHYYRPYRYYGPAIGFRVGVLPFGYLTLGPAWNPYYYYDGFFYQPYATGPSQSEQYQVVDPPMGVVIPTLPSGVNTTVINGNTYYEKNGTYYQEVIQNNETKYVVVGKNGQLDVPQGQQDNSQQAPDPEVYDRLPDGSKSVEINGQQMYVAPDGMYYQQVTNPDGTTGYQLVGRTSGN